MHRFKIENILLLILKGKKMMKEFISALHQRKITDEVLNARFWDNIWMFDRLRTD
jgi:hypothetical protein